MNGIRFEQVSKKYGAEEILSNFDLKIPLGKFFALLGPSGCGKTTILRLIAGFETPDSGRIFIEGEEVTYVPINKRRVNTVFQQYALFPHLTVFENVAYGLVIKGVSKDEVMHRVMRILHKVHLEKHANKSIEQLSGGQQQRVALARAIVNEPKVLLLDEPLAALDRTLKERMLVELIELQCELKTTFVYVTHDASEALAVSDQLVIMNEDGIVEQQGTPKEVYEFPRSSFVSQFVGKTNLISGSLACEENACVLQVPGVGSLPVASDQLRAQELYGRAAFLNIRPEKIEINKQAQDGFSNHLNGVVDAMIFHGSATEYLVKIGGGNTLMVYEQNEEHFVRETIEEGASVHLYWQKENAVLLER